MTRIDRRRQSKQQIQRATEALPLPSHPYRDSAIFYGVLAAILIGVTYWTGGGILRAVLIAIGFFVVATAFTWLRFRTKIAERDEEASR
jgi:asparagine N-glycosylation enzyme membrane subunit Stt3